uniref:Uncharacterized protein n=1 Tax=Ananas comosus var. bracteatus TaxID=296719 RepID=A0A6V7QN10_ANACO|nr:unnamed protein product [Ananas comosus var. bracteatus]
MAGREVREYTNLSDPKDKKWGKGKDKIDDEDITFQRMVAKMQEVAGERGGYLHGRGALDSDDLLYLKEQMEAEEDAERLLRRTEKRAFAAFKISFFFGFVNSVFYKAAILADSTPASLPLPLRVEPKPKSGIRQQDLLKNIVEIKPKRPRVDSPSNREQSDRSNASNGGNSGKTPLLGNKSSESVGVQVYVSSEQEKSIPLKSSRDVVANKAEAAGGSLLGLSYESSDED